MKLSFRWYGKEDKDVYKRQLDKSTAEEIDAYVAKHSR